ncbi:MAG: hypothetical protein KDA91_14530 [Planctomycetaceae bacterium]|nr:hypothetical protein [Planctomycetaceae bacterium]
MIFERGVPNHGNREQQPARLQHGQTSGHVAKVINRSIDNAADDTKERRSSLTIEALMLTCLGGKRLDRLARADAASLFETSSLPGPRRRLLPEVDRLAWNDRCETRKAPWLTDRRTKLRPARTRPPRHFERAAVPAAKPAAFGGSERTVGPRMVKRDKSEGRRQV